MPIKGLHCHVSELVRSDTSHVPRQEPEPEPEPEPDEEEAEEAVGLQGRRGR